MVNVEVCDDDVAHVVSPEAESFDLVSGGFHVVEHWSDDGAGRTNTLWRGEKIGWAEAGVDKDQTVVGFDEQHVAHQRSGRHLHGAAVEVVNFHDATPSPSAVTLKVLRKLQTSW